MKTLACKPLILTKKEFKTRYIVPVVEQAIEEAHRTGAHPVDVINGWLKGSKRRLTKKCS